MNTKPTATNPEVVRSVDAGSYLERLLIFSIASVLVIRVFLEFTGYPQLGGGGLHIAHMLWGGLFMLAAIVVMLALVGKAARSGGAILAGIGFGTFIDELGNFITADNNYFFQPTIALIYLIFVALFFTFRELGQSANLAPEALLVNASDMVTETLRGGASPEEVSKTLGLLEQSGERGAVTEGIRQTVLAAPRVEEGPPSLTTRVSFWLRHAYERLVRWHLFHTAIVALFVVYGVQVLLFALSIIFQVGPAPLMTLSDTSFWAIGNLIASVAVGALIAVGVVRLLHSRVDGYRWFKRAVLVSIFFVEFFAFYWNELRAVGGLAVDLLLLGGLNYMIEEESAK